MSKTWWNDPKTTTGHGRVSQYKQEHWKEEIYKENRRGAKATGAQPEAFDSVDSFLRSSLHLPSTSDTPVEQRHHAATRTLEELRRLQQPPPPPSTGHTLTQPPPPSVVAHQPLEGGKYLPHLAHHHHFGWNPPTPEKRVAVVDSRTNFYKMGNAQKSNQDIWSKASLITTRKA